MTQHAYPRPGTANARDVPESRTRPVETGTRWTGKLVFGGVMMIVAGLFNVIIGVVALFNSHYYVVGPSGLLVLNLSGWGWLHLILGALVAVTGGVLFTGATWARVITVLLAGFNALASLAFLSAYPLWSIVVIALDVLVIWAVITAGTEAEE
ncbi:DUF7144 family membrane protein [Amycolatopsis alkalitolerans]|uniref:DUF7144 domain-containing protein n=1 Tax=Amycolatopsis alkalitolerans TaxID=2547244 RepID=A0A5C4M810_9PSEU|nr:hypothetical protein [Amycolatopsis alkalitolerans]TNC29125.1 hypothetical protein FG385_03230 [Amycolatopsis alkalitolerans]